MANRFVWLFLFSVVGSFALACNIPVFRYALERWRPDPCQIVVFHAGPLSQEEAQAIGSKLPQRVEGYGSKSMGNESDLLGRVSFAEVDTLEGEHKILWDRLTDRIEPKLPYMVVRGSFGPSKWLNVWEGMPNDLPNANLFDSPARKELSRRLLSGDSVVWVLLTGKDEEKNQKARKLLNEELPKIADEIQLPEGIGLPGSELYSEVPLLVKFSVLEIEKQDKKESFLVNLFSKIRSEEAAGGEPLVVPVFGRGRALEVIPAAELNPRLMTDLTLFLSGACSCQVKDQNPGFDLLINCDWKQELFLEGTEPPPARSTGQGDRTKQPQLLSIPPGR